MLSADDADLIKQLSASMTCSRWTPCATTGRPAAAAAPAGRPARAVVIYTPFAPAEGYAMSRGEAQMAARAQIADYWDQRPSEAMNFVHLLQMRLGAEVRDLTPILDGLRSIKSPREIDLIRRASQIAALGMIEAMKAREPGVYEYQLDAAARYVFLANGARLDAYRSIIGAGMANIVNMHYFRNTSQLKDGDLVLMDYAPDFHYYTSDIGRMWPVNGTFRSGAACVARLHPGVPRRGHLAHPARRDLTAGDGGGERGDGAGVRSLEVREARTRAGRAGPRQTGGGVFSHAVGMAVHDDGGRSNPLGGTGVLGRSAAAHPRRRQAECCTCATRTSAW